MISYDLIPFLLTVPLSLILDSRSLGDFSFLSVFTFHYRARYFVGTFSSGALLRVSIERPFLHLWFTEVYAYFRTRSGHDHGVRTYISRGVYIDIYLDIGV